MLENEGMAPEGEEQTWPSASEMAHTDAITTRRLAPGTSDYQATWIVDDDDAEDDEEAPEATALANQSDGARVDTASQHRSDSNAAASNAAADVVLDHDMQAQSDDEDAAGASGSDAAMEEALAPEEVARVRRERRHRAEEDEALYPDEVEVPPDVKARVRWLQ